MFVELHARSAFSFLEAAALPEALAERAALLEQPALALLDRDGLYGAPRFYRAATRAGIKPLVGAEVTLAGGGRLPLLVERPRGLSEPLPLLTQDEDARVQARRRRHPGRAGGARGRARVPHGRRGRAGGARAGRGRRHPRRGRPAFDRLVGIFGRGNVFAELQRHLRRAQEARNEWLRGRGDGLGLPLARHQRAAPGRARRPAAAGRRSRASATTPRWTGAGRLLADNSERYAAAPPAEMERLFADCPRRWPTPGSWPFASASP